MINQGRLKEVLEYNPASGVFTWNVYMGSRAVAGSHAGSVDSLGYVTIRIDKKLYHAHRLAWLFVHGHFPVNTVDHINRDKSDNRMSNLRPATRSENNRNVGISKNNTTGFKGVTKVRDRYKAQITHHSTCVNIGLYDTPEIAHAAYCKKATELHGEFANYG